MKPVLIFDLDDTLCGVELGGRVRPGYEAYNDTIRRFGGAMQALGFDREVAIGMHKHIDEEMCRKVGFGDKTRFAWSMVNAYKVLSGPKYRREDADYIYKVGMSVFTDYPYVALEQALHVLATYHWHYEIAVVTKGETEEQHKKMRDTRLDFYTDHVIVCGRKDDAEWGEVLYTLGLEEGSKRIPQSWAIGNSAKADVNPLLKRGFNALHISDPDGWSFESAEYEQPWPERKFAVIRGVSECFNHIPLLG